MNDLPLIQPQRRDLGGGFTVRRLLPALSTPSIGPFVFFDHFGPIEAHPGDEHDVRPHPHIGLATVTYLYEGAMMHRDSLGSVQRIEPGAINWMSAGRGITHSERTPDDLRPVVHTSHGLQLWVGLPESDEEGDPRFEHTPAAAIPVVERPGARVRVLAGTAFGATSPVRTSSPTVFLDMALSAGATLRLEVEATERALYSSSGTMVIDGREVPEHVLVVLAEGSTPELSVPTDARIALIGGEPLGKRHLWWNFVSSRAERLREAALDWRDDRFPHVPGETEFIPLPDRPLPR